MLRASPIIFCIKNVTCLFYWESNIRYVTHRQHKLKSQPYYEKAMVTNTVYQLHPILAQVHWFTYALHAPNFSVNINTLQCCLANKDNSRTSNLSGASKRS